MATGNSNSQVLFTQVESSQGTIPNSTGTATLANGDACRAISVSINTESALIDRPDKTAILTQTAGVRGRGGANWSTKMSLAGSGTAGTVPDCDDLLRASFGKAATVVSSTSATYAIEDASPYLSIWNFRDPSGMTQQVAHGSVVSRMMVEFGSDVATIEFNGESVWGLDSAHFAAADSTQKGGLAAFPSRPSAPTTVGNFAVGFVGSVTLDGTAYTGIRSGRLNFDWQRSLRKDIYNSYYPGSAQQGKRVITLDLELDDEDTAALNTLKQKAISKTAVAITIVIGATAGNIWTFSFPTVQLPAYSFNDGQTTWGLSLQGCRAIGTSKDECTLEIT